MDVFSELFSNSVYEGRVTCWPTKISFEFWEVDNSIVLGLVKDFSWLRVIHHILKGIYHVVKNFKVTDMGNSLCALLSRYLKSFCRWFAIHLYALTLINITFHHLLGCHYDWHNASSVISFISLVILQSFEQGTTLCTDNRAYLGSDSPEQGGGLPGLLGTAFLSKANVFGDTKC